MPKVGLFAAHDSGTLESCATRMPMSLLEPAKVHLGEPAHPVRACHPRLRPRKFYRPNYQKQMAKPYLLYQRQRLSCLQLQQHQRNLPSQLPQHPVLLFHPRNRLVEVLPMARLGLLGLRLLHPHQRKEQRDSLHRLWLWRSRIPRWALPHQKYR